MNKDFAHWLIVIGLPSLGLALFGLFHLISFLIMSGVFWLGLQYGIIVAVTLLIVGAAHYIHNKTLK